MSAFLNLLFTCLSFVNVLFAVVIVFTERKNPAGTWAWVMVIVFVPFVGFFLYLLIGLDSRKYRRFAEKGRQDEGNFEKLLEMNMEGHNFIRSQRTSMEHREVLRIPGAEHLNDLAALNFSDGHGALSSNNGLTVYHDGNTKFADLLVDINNAESFIHIMYYIVRADRIGREMIDALSAAAARGVEVKMLLDGMGCYGTPKRLFKPLKKTGGEVSIFWPPHFARVNFRNHRKLCVIDGKSGYLGGMNIGDEYLGRVNRFGFWRDTHIKITGDAIKELEIRFISDWNFSVPDRPADGKLKFQAKYFPVLERKNGVCIQIVSSGPDTKWSNIYNGYAKMMAEADRNIYIQTPYFSPDDCIFQSLRIAALSGIDVRIVIPANPDHYFVYWASLSYLGELIKAGVKCYQYEKGFIHSKLLCVDGTVCSTGTANMDVRSFNLNFELNAFIYDRNVTKQLEEAFLRDLDDCTEITPGWYNSRPKFDKIKESVSRLLSPLL